MKNKRAAYGFLRGLIILMIISALSLACKQEKQSKSKSVEIKSPEVAAEVYSHRSISDLLKVVALRHITDLEEGEYKKGDWAIVINSKPPKTPYWSYPLGVTLYGMQRANKILKEPSIDEYVKRLNKINADNYEYLRWQIYTFGTYTNGSNYRKLMRLNMLDDCGAMGAQLLEAIMRSGMEVNPNISKLLDITGNYVTNVQSRLPNGTFWRPKSPNSPTIWGDDLYMSCPFLIRWAEYKKDPKVLDDAARQIINFASYLQDVDGVWWHGYYVKEKKHSLAKWGRANGWVMVATAEVLSVLPENHPKRDSVLTIFKKQIEGLKKLQDKKSGLWYQVLDHPELNWGVETSCSAMFTYAIARAVNRGWIDKSNMEVVQRAINGLNKKVSADGAVLGVCRSASIGNDFKYYEDRPTAIDDQHGRGTMLLALSEYLLATQGK